MIGLVDKVLVLAPHPDDGELGAGATLSRLLRSGAEVHYVAFSDCEDSVPVGWPSDVLVEEASKATRALGIAPDNLRILDFTVRRFPEARQEVLQVMVDLDRELNPDLVLLPAGHDVHQDHQVVSIEGTRAFKRRTILGYEIPWNHLEFRSKGFVVVSESDVEAKVRAISKYRSQGGRPYVDAEYTRAHLIDRGRQVGVEYAEAFEVIRMVVSDG